MITLLSLTVLKHTEEKLVIKYSFQFVFRRMTLMDVSFITQIQGRQGSSSISLKEGEEKNKRKGKLCVDVS